MHAARIPSQDEVLQAFRRAGLSSLTPLQQKLIPILLNRRDAIAEASAGGGTSSAIAASLALGLRGTGPALKVLVLLPTAEDVGKLARAFVRFVRAVRDAPAFVALGEIDDARREQRRLERESTVVAGTTDRVIDHIRRGGLSFDELQQVIMREPQAEARADFVKDVQFISAKWSERPRVVLISRGPVAADDELAQILHHPVTMETPEKGQPAAASAPAAGLPSAGRAGTASPGAGIGSPGAGRAAGISGGSRSAFVIDRAPRTESLARVILGLRLPPLVALHAQKTDARGVAEGLRTRGLRAVVLPPGGGRQQADRRDALVAFSRRAVDVLLVPFTGTVAPDLEDLGPAQVALLDLPTGPIRSPGGMLKRASVLALVERERDLGRLQEAIGVAFQRNNIPDDEALLTGMIDRILRRAKEEDRAELSRLRDRIRRQVPLLMRPFFMASLLKALLPAGVPAPREKAVPGPDRAGIAGDRVSAGDRTGAAEKPAPGGRGRGGALAAASAPHIPPKGQRGRFGRAVEAGPQRAPSAGDSAQLFVSVGRNRRVFARDLTELFTEKLQLSAGDIRDVRVFDKYSFVDIAPSRAEEAISRLSGIEVKGRPITVNYAKKKEEKGAK